MLGVAEHRLRFGKTVEERTSSSRDQLGNRDFECRVVIIPRLADGAPLAHFPVVIHTRAVCPRAYCGVGARRARRAERRARSRILCGLQCVSPLHRRVVWVCVWSRWNCYILQSPSLHPSVLHLHVSDAPSLAARARGCLHAELLLCC